MATKGNKSVDITKVGPIGYRELQQANEQNLTGISPEFQLMSQGIQQKYAPISLYDASANAEQLVQSSMANSPTAWGESSFDEDYATEEQFQHLEDIRANNQPWYSQIANGITKGAILVGTTFLDGTIGLLIGAGTALNEGRWSGLWDNDFSRAMQSINEGAEQVMPNYYTEAEQNQPWYENIFTSNFIGDKFIKNLGFTIGAFYSGGLGAGILRGAGRLAMGTAKKLGATIGTIKKISKASSMVASAVGTVTSAVNEGRIEALNNSKDWYETQKMQIDDTYQQRLASIQQEYEATRGHLSGTMETGFVDPAYEKYKEALSKEQSSYEATLAKLNEDRLKMGNMDLIFNLPILTASNIIQFGKMYANGFRTGKRSNKILGSITEGYKAGTTRGAGIRKAILNPLSEGTEEISQGAASRISGNYYQTDVNNFYKAKTDPDAQQETLSWWKSFAQGINETVNDGSSWEEFFIGTLTGGLGMPRFRSARNAQGKFQSPITLEGGVFGELRENREQMAREQEIVDYMNNRLQSPEFRNYYQGLSRHRYYQSAMDQAAQDDDEFAFKNAEQAQFVSDVAMFDAAGKIEDLVTLINSAYDTSDENLESIGRNTRSVVTAKQQAQEINEVLRGLESIGQEAEQKGDEETLSRVHVQIQALNDKLSNLRDIYIGPFTDQDGNPLYATEQGKKDMIDKLTKTKDEMIGQIDDYVKAKIDLQSRLPQSIGNDQLEELIFLQTQVNNWNKRGEEMTPVIKSILTNVSSSLRTLASAQELGGNTKDSELNNSNAQFIEQLIQDNTPEQLMQILSNPGNSKLVLQILDTIYNYGEDVISNLDKQTVIQMLNDIVKIGKSKDLYQKRVQEYISNPAAQAQAHKQVREHQETIRQASKGISTVDKINNSSVSEVVQSIDDEEIDFDSLDNIFSEEEASDAKEKVQQAKDIIDTSKRVSQDIDQLASSGKVSEQAAADAQALLNNSKSVANSSEELIDLDTEAFNDPHSLDDVDARETIAQIAEKEGWTLDQAQQEYNDVMNQRLDAAKNALSIARSIGLERDAQLSNIPSHNNTSRVFKVGDVVSLRTDVNNPTANKFTIIADKGNYYEATIPGDSQVYRIKKSDAANYDIYTGASIQTGHDSVDKNEPVNTPKQKQVSSNATIADKILSDAGLSTDNQLAKSIKEVLDYADTYIKRGVNGKELFDLLRSTISYGNAANYGPKIMDALYKVINDKMSQEASTTSQQSQSRQVDTTPNISPEVIDTHIDTENQRDTSNQTTEAAIEVAQREGTSISAGKVGGTYNYWRPSTTELPIHRERGNDTPYWQTVNSPARERYQAVYEYLKNNGAFSRVNNNQVKKGDEVHFGISKELTEKVGKPVILILNSNNEVIGDLPMPEDSSFNSYVGLPQLYSIASDWYQKNHESLHTEGNDIAVIPSYKSNVARNMVGKPQYTSQDERHTLNQISTITTSDGSQKQVPFRLGIAVANADSDRVRIMSDAGRSKSQGASPLERTIIAPLRAMKGQPFLLMPTSSDTRAFMPVPIMMPTFDMSNPVVANSTLGQEISKKVQELTTIPNNTDQIMKWVDSMQELLSIPEIHVNFSAPTFTAEGREQQELIVTIKRPGESKQTTIFKGPQEQAVDAVLNGLSGSMFQVSRKYINDTYNGRSYNEMIGELAETNLPIGATHTINDWFTIDPIIDNKQQKAHSPKSTRVNPTQTQGTVIRFQDASGTSYYLTSSNRLYRENPEGGDIELTDNKYNYLKAHAYGARINETFTRPYDTPWGYYNPQTGKFEVKPTEKPQQEEVVNTNSESRVQASERDITGSEVEISIDSDIIDWKQQATGGTREDGTKITPDNVTTDDEMDAKGQLRLSTMSASGEFQPFKATKIFYTKDGRIIAKNAEGVVLHLKSDPLAQHTTEQTKQSVPQSARQNSLDALKKMGLLNKKERNAALDKLSDDRLAKVAGMPKLRARQTLERFDIRIKANMDSDSINDAFDSVVGSRPLNREVTKEMETQKNWNRDSEVARVKKMLPQLSEEGRVKLVDALIKIINSPKPAYAYGQFQNGIITLSKFGRGTAYHESFHFVTQTLLNPQELKTLYQDARQKYGNLKRLELEEKLAEDFREFMQSYEDDGFFKNIFKTLKHIIKSLIGKETITNKLFHDIRRGALASRTVNPSSSVLNRNADYDDLLVQKSELETQKYYIEEALGEYENLTSKVNAIKQDRQRFKPRRDNSARKQRYYMSVGFSSREEAEQLSNEFGQIPRVWEDAPNRKWYAVVYQSDIKRAFSNIGSKPQMEQELNSINDKLSQLRESIEDMDFEENYYREIEQYHREKLDYGRLNQEQKDYITERGLTIEEYNSMTQQGKEVLFRCMY